MEASTEAAENVNEEKQEDVETAAPGEPEEPPQQQKQKEQLQAILANVRQNFGKINVAPEFNDEDLVPVEIPDLDLSDFSGSEAEEEVDDDEEEEKEKEKEDRANVEQADGEADVAEPTTTATVKANNKKGSREVIRALDEKIAKYKQFLDRAKSKRFSEIRSVENLTHILALLSRLYFSEVTWRCQAADAAHLSLV